MSYMKQRFNPYTLFGGKSDPSYSIRLGFNGESMTFQMEVVNGPPTIELALKYLTDTVVKTVEIIKEKEYCKPGESKDSTTKWCYGFMWRHYCNIAKDFKKLVGEQIYKSLLE